MTDETTETGAETVTFASSDIIGLHAWPDDAFSLPNARIRLARARVTQRIGEIARMEIEAVSTDRQLALGQVVGATFGVRMQTDLRPAGRREALTRYHLGLCTEAEQVAVYEDYGLYRFVLRDPVWLLTRRRDCRVFQNCTTSAIVAEILGEIGLADITLNLFGEEHEREYCVQYNETDYDFISRLMQEEGYYWWFEHGAEGSGVLITNDASMHVPLDHAEPADSRDATPVAAVEFLDPTLAQRDHLSTISRRRRITTNRVVLEDYNFARSDADVLGTYPSAPGATPADAIHEAYDYAARQPDEDRGGDLARWRQESLAWPQHVLEAVGNQRTMAVGRTMTLVRHPVAGYNAKYLVLGAVFDFRVPIFGPSSGSGADPDIALLDLFGDGLATSLDGQREIFRVRCELLPDGVQFRAPQSLPRPRIGGIQTAIVTGDSAGDINCDDYGRVKVKFHWDRRDATDGTTSMWVRTAMPWTGRNWGMIAIPRVGQEVVVQFEDGHPDRPIITGMLYNSRNMPPYELPDRKAHTGIRTRTHPDGAGYNEMVMIDDADAQKFRIHAERDYERTVERDETTEVRHDQSIAVGCDQSIEVEDDRTLTVGHDEGRTIKNNLTQTTYLFNTDRTWGFKTDFVGAVRDDTAGVMYSELTGMGKFESVGIYKSETIGIPSSGSNDGSATAGLIAGIAGTAASIGATMQGSEGAAIGAAVTGGITGAVAAALGTKMGKDEAIYGDSTLDVHKPRGVPMGDRTVTIHDGAYALTVATGTYTLAVDTGTIDIAAEGNVDLASNAGTMFVEANGDLFLSSTTSAVDIEGAARVILTVGSNTVTLTSAGIELAGSNVTIKGTTALALQAPKIDINGGTMTTVKGGLVKIN